MQTTNVHDLEACYLLASDAYEAAYDRCDCYYYSEQGLPPPSADDREACEVAESTLFAIRDELVALVPNCAVGAAEKARFFAERDEFDAIEMQCVLATLAESLTRG